MPFVVHDGARIHWEAEGQGTPVLLIMGFSYSASMWYPIREALAKSHRVITFDNRGTGESDDTSGVSLEQIAGDALAVLRAAGEEKAHIYGASMGGAIAAEFGMAYAQHALSVTLGCTMLKTTREGHRNQRPPWLFYLPHWLVRRMLLKAAKPENYGSAAPRDAALRDIAMLAENKFTMKGIREQNRAITNYVTTHERAREKLTMPILVMHGDEDKTVPVKFGRELHAVLPHSQYVEFHGAGHNYQIAGGAKVNLTFIEFIEAVDVHNGSVPR